MDVDEAIVDVIAAAIGSLTKGDNLLMGPVRPAATGEPTLACFVLKSGGRPIEPYAGGDTVSDDEFVSVQIRLRGDRKKFGDGQTLAKQILDAVHKSNPTDCLPDSTLAIQAEPIYIGEDEQGNPEWSMNFETVRSDA